MEYVRISVLSVCQCQLTTEDEMFSYMLRIKIQFREEHVEFICLFFFHFSR
jgi:hypothetical protein